MKPSVTLAPNVPCPPKRSQVQLTRLHVRPGQTCWASFAAPSYWSTLTHWIGGRTLPCLAYRQACTWCLEGHRQIWTAFAVVHGRATGIPHYMVWYEAAHHGCPQLEREQGRLTRAMLSLKRLGDYANSPLRIEWTGKRRQGDLYPVEDVRCYLGHMWGIDLIGEGR